MKPFIGQREGGGTGWKRVPPQGNIAPEDLFEGFVNLFRIHLLLPGDRGKEDQPEKDQKQNLPEARKRNPQGCQGLGTEKGFDRLLGEIAKFIKKPGEQAPLTGICLKMLAHKQNKQGEEGGQGPESTKDLIHGREGMGDILLGIGAGDRSKEIFKKGMLSAKDELLLAMKVIEEKGFGNPCPASDLRQAERSRIPLT
jgi:hypothetical protein